MSKSLKRWLLTALAALALQPAFAGSAEIQITRAWSRASVGSGGNGVVYLTIENTGTQIERVVSVATPIAKHASLHKTVEEDGMVRMLPVPNLEIAPTSWIVFEPGGLHVMLMGLRAPIEAGSRFPLTVRFEKVGPIETEVVAGSVGALAYPDDIEE